MKKAAIIFFAVFLAGSVAKSEESTQWKECPKGYEYKSEGFSCKVNSSGRLEALRFGDKKLIDIAQVFARLKTKGLKDEVRIFQNAKVSSVLKTRKEKDKIILICYGPLQSKETGNIAEFKEKITISPGKIILKYEVKTLVEVEMKHWSPFCSLLSSKIENFIGYALDTVDKKGENGIYEIPEKYSKEKESWSRLLNKAKFVLDGKVFELSLNDEKKYLLSVSDGRSWGGKGVEIIVKPIMPKNKGKGNHVLYPAGFVFKWSFTLSANN
jgi:hypothetical protein